MGLLATSFIALRILMVNTTGQIGIIPVQGRCTLAVEAAVARKRSQFIWTKMTTDTVFTHIDATETNSVQKVGKHGDHISTMETIYQGKGDMKVVIVMTVLVRIVCWKEGRALEKRDDTGVMTEAGKNDMISRRRAQWKELNLYRMIGNGDTGAKTGAQGEGMKVAVSM